MKTYWIGSCALAALGFAAGSSAEPAGTLLFAQPGTKIVSESGNSRDANRGDTLQTGERLLTPPGAISQVLLPDGSLIGVRPASELRLDPPPAGGDTKAPVLSLVQGTVRVIASELMDPRKTSNLTLQTGGATLKLKGADLESGLVKGDARTAPADAAPGSYQRLLVGSGTVAHGSAVAALAPRQTSFLGGTPPAGPKGTPAMPPVASAAPIARGNPPLNNAALKPVNTIPMPLAPVVAPAPKPCTRFIGKTCIP